MSRDIHLQEKSGFQGPLSDFSCIAGGGVGGSQPNSQVILTRLSVCVRLCKHKMVVFSSFFDLLVVIHTDKTQSIDATVGLYSFVPEDDKLHIASFTTRDQSFQCNRRLLERNSTPGPGR